MADNFTVTTDQQDDCIVVTLQAEADIVAVDNTVSVATTAKNVAMAASSALEAKNSAIASEVSSLASTASAVISNNSAEISINNATSSSVSASNSEISNIASKASATDSLNSSVASENSAIASNASAINSSNSAMESQSSAVSSQSSALGSANSATASEASAISANNSKEFASASAIAAQNSAVASAISAANASASEMALTDVYTKTQMDNSMALKAPLMSPEFTGTPTINGESIVATTDERLSNARTPVAHSQKWSTITDIPTLIGEFGITDVYTKSQVNDALAAQEFTVGDVTTTTSGLMIPEDKTKLNGIESGANNYTLPSTINSDTTGNAATATIATKAYYA